MVVAADEGVGLAAAPFVVIVVVAVTCDVTC